MKKAMGFGVVLVALGIAGCGPAAPAGDAGRDTGPALDTVHWSVSGARTATFDYDGDSNYVSCLVDASGLFNIRASSSAGGSDSVNFTFDAYDGPGTYDFTYATGGGPSGDVHLASGHNYWFFYNRSSTTLAMSPSICTLVVAGDDTRIGATLSCSEWVANITSPDYEDVDAEGFKPSITLSAQFSCAI